jgi:hypothetical protein
MYFANLPISIITRLISSNHSKKICVARAKAKSPVARPEKRTSYYLRKEEAEFTAFRGAYFFVGAAVERNPGSNGRAP